MKEYSIQKIIINSEINTFAFIFIIWIFEEIIYLILGIYYTSFENLFFGGIKIQNIFVTLLSVYNDIGNYFFLAYNLDLATKGYNKSFSHLTVLFLYIYGFWAIYIPTGYVLLSNLATIFEFIGYRLFITLIDNKDIFIEIYNDESHQQLIEDTNNDTNININMGTTNYSSDQLNNNTDISTPYNDNYNYDERLAKLEEENIMIKSDKRSLENENKSLRITINALKIKNEKLTQENEKLIAELAEKETEIQQLKKEY